MAISLKRPHSQADSFEENARNVLDAYVEVETDVDPLTHVDVHNDVVTVDDNDLPDLHWHVRDPG